MSFYNTAFLLSQFILLKSLFVIVLIIDIYICIKNSHSIYKKKKNARESLKNFDLRAFLFFFNKV